MTEPSTILLVGHPNVGKSVLFNQLAGASITESNYPGTTVDYTEGKLTLGDRSLMIIDTPGTFSLDARDRAEEVTVELLEATSDALIIGVIDATRIERGLHLLLELVEQEHDLLVALNMWDQALQDGIDIDLDRLEQILAVPVVPTVATEGRGIAQLENRIDEATTPSIDGIQKRAQQTS